MPPSLPSSASSVFNVRRFGARGDGLTLDTAAIQAAIDAVEAEGGGTVLLPPGRYLSHSLRLVSHLTLHLTGGAELIAAEPPAPGEPGGYDAPEEGPPHHWQDFGHSKFKNSLLWGIDLTHLTLQGPGLIFGRGLSRGNGRIASPFGHHAPQPPGHLPDVLEADGEVVAPARPDLQPGPFGYPNARDTLPAGVGNKAIALLRCAHVRIRDLTLLHAGHFAVLATACRHVWISDLLIDTNRDGIDIDGGNQIFITRCSVNSPWDDGICLKSSCGSGEPVVLENVTVSDCYVSGFVEGTLYDGTRQRLIQHRGGPIGRIKLGTESSGGYRNIAITNCIFEHCRGLALEQVDGGFMTDIVISNLVMREVMNAPVFIRLGGRLRGPDAKQPGTAERISISHVVAHDVASDHGVFIAGVPDYPLRELNVFDFQLHFRGGGTESDARRVVPELIDGYPEPMLFGRLNAWGLWARHVEGLHVRDFHCHARLVEARPAVFLDDVRRSEFTRIRLTAPAQTIPWQMRSVSDLRIHDCDHWPNPL